MIECSRPSAYCDGVFVLACKNPNMMDKMVELIVNLEGTSGLSSKMMIDVFHRGKSSGVSFSDGICRTL